MIICRVTIIICCALNTNRISIEDKQSHFLSQLQTASSNFLTQFSLQELVKKNNSPSGLLFAKRNMGGISGGMSGGDSEQTTHSKHESFACRIESKDSDNFNRSLKV